MLGRRAFSATAAATAALTLARGRVVAQTGQKVLRVVPQAEPQSFDPRRRERQMQRFKSPEQAQNFLSAHAFIHGHLHPRRHLLSADAYRTIRTAAFDVWQQETCAQHAT
jgi:transposase-like protein